MNTRSPTAAPREVVRGISEETSLLSRPRIDHRGAARVGGTLQVRVRGALPNGLTFLAWGPMANVDLGPIGAPGNRRYVGAMGGGAFAVPTNSLGRAATNVPIPAVPGFLGANLSLQWAVFDPMANALGVVASDALGIVVGA